MCEVTEKISDRNEKAMTLGAMTLGEAQCLVESLAKNIDDPVLFVAQSKEQARRDKLENLGIYVDIKRKLQALQVLFDERTRTMTLEQLRDELWDSQTKFEKKVLGEGSCFILTNKDKIVAIGKGNRYLKVDGQNIITHSIREPQIVINNKLDPVTTLYDPNGKRVGKIRNNTAMMDVCAQIAQKHLTGYYVKYKGEKLVIRDDGRIKNPPEGFYDSLDNSMKVILGF